MWVGVVERCSQPRLSFLCLTVCVGLLHSRRGCGGGNRSAMLWKHRNSSYSMVPVNDSIVHRLDRLLNYA